MFNLFNDSARITMALARDVAIEYHHNYIGTEHIALALAREETGLARKVLDELGVSSSRLKTEMNKVLVVDPTKDYSLLPFTPNAKKLLENAVNEATQLNHDYIDTAHLLLGLLNDSYVGMKVIQNLGVDAKSIRNKVLEKLKDNNLLNEAEQVKNKNQQSYWLLPRTLSVEQILPMLGYDIYNDTLGIGRQVMINDYLIGRLNKKDGKTTFLVIYKIGNESQLEEALRFRSILDLNELEYEEQPSSEELKDELEKVSKRLYD